MAINRWMRSGQRMGLLYFGEVTVYNNSVRLLTTWQDFRMLSDMYRSTFLCYLELVVKGGPVIVIAAVQEVCTLLLFL